MTMSYDVNKHAKRLVKKFTEDLQLGSVFYDPNDPELTNKNFTKFERYLRSQLQQAYDRGVEATELVSS